LGWGAPVHKTGGQSVSFRENWCGTVLLVPGKLVDLKLKRIGIFVTKYVKTILFIMNFGENNIQKEAFLTNKNVSL
jgi:hypothetical protein